MSVFIVFSRHAHDDDMKHVEQVASTEDKACSLCVSIIQEEHVISGDWEQINEISRNHWSDGFIHTWYEEYELV